MALGNGTDQNEFDLEAKIPLMVGERQDVLENRAIDVKDHDNGNENVNRQAIKIGKKENSSCFGERRNQTENMEDDCQSEDTDVNGTSEDTSSCAYTKIHKSTHDGNNKGGDLMTDNNETGGGSQDIKTKGTDSHTDLDATVGISVKLVPTFSSPESTNNHGTECKSHEIGMYVGFLLRNRRKILIISVILVFLVVLVPFLAVFKVSPSTNIATDSQWSGWEEWGISNCYNGLQSRKRTCALTASWGKPCYGNLVDYRLCPATDGQWSGWGEWGINKCDNGLQSRHRTCTKTVSWDNPCRGDSVDYRLCPATDGQWSGWSEWGMSGNGLQSRHRNCSKADLLSTPCQGQPIEYRLSNATDGQWSGWGEWGIYKCDNGLQSRHRTCTQTTPWSKPCHGDSVDYRLCPATDGQWSGWSEWEMSGNGLQSRHRNCLIPDLFSRPCQGQPIEYQLYKATDGIWSGWSGWAESTCDSGLQSRHRTCFNPEPLGKPCPGQSVDYRICAGLVLNSSQRRTSKELFLTFLISLLNSLRQLYLCYHLRSSA